MVGICVGHAMTHWYPGAFTVILPFFAQDLGLTLTQVGLLIGLRNVTGTLINLPGGMLVDIVGRRKLIMGLAIAWTGIPYLLLGLTYNFVLIALFLGVVGVGNLLFHPAALSSLSELYPTRRGFATAMHQLGASFGDTLGPFCIGIVLTWATWRQVTLANAIPGIVMSIIFWRLMRHVQLRRPRPAGRLALRSYMQAVSSLFKNANLVLLALLGGARSMTQSGLTVFLPIYLTTVSMLSPALVGKPESSRALCRGAFRTASAAGRSSRPGCSAPASC